MIRADSPSPLIPFLVACLGIAIYSTMDVVMKGLSIGIGAYNAVIWRTAAGTLLTGSFYLMMRPNWPDSFVMRLHIVRSACVAAMALFFFWGLARLPMAEAISLAFIAPLLAIILAAIFLGEAIDRRSIAASCLGLAGVIIIVTGKLGGSDYQQDALLAVGSIFLSAIFYAFNLILARKQAKLAHPMEIAFYQNLYVTLILGLGAPWLLILPGAALAVPIFSAAIMGSASVFLLSWAYARAKTQILSTTEYTGFLWAMLYGWVFYAEPVTWPTVAGAVLIVSACIAVSRRTTGTTLAEPATV